MEISRRDFIKLSGPAIGLLAALGLPKKVLAGGTDDCSLSGTRMAILYDSSKCVGCRLCEAACRMENHLPQERELGKLSKTSWTATQTIPTAKGQDLHLKRQCLHCTEASCVSVCPTGAAAHHSEFVVINQEWCIGCGYCEESCPFGVPFVGEEKGVAKKCTFCFSRITEGSNPACVAACPSGALSFGPRAELIETATTRVQSLLKNKLPGAQVSRPEWPEANLYGVTELGGLGVMYILLKPPAFYGLPEVPHQATENVLTQWTGSSITAAALVLPFWFFFKRTPDKKAKDEKKEGTE
jgi:formate dehydrogenase iron-sulfur subunit